MIQSFWYFDAARDEADYSNILYVARCVAAYSIYAVRDEAAYLIYAAKYEAAYLRYATWYEAAYLTDVNAAYIQQ